MPRATPRPAPATTSRSCSATSRARPSRRRCASCWPTPCSRRAPTRRPSGRPSRVVPSPTASGGSPQEAEPGSDAQFQFVMNFAAIAEAGSHVDELADLYDGTLELEGLEIDTDLGWELLIALVAAGRAGDAEIDERLAARQHRDRPAVRRARPRRDPDARGQGARLVVAHRRRHRHEHRGARDGGGLPARERPGPARGVRRAVLRDARAIWEERSYAIAEKLVDGLYPSPLANRALADASRALARLAPRRARAAPPRRSSDSPASTARSPRRSATRRTRSRGIRSHRSTD